MPSRRQAVLAGHRQDPATARAALVEADPLVRMAALGALRRAGALTDADIEAALTDPDPRVVRRAITLAAARPGVSIRDLLDAPDPATVEVAAWACGERLAAESEVVARLCELATRHGEPLVREAAVAALGALGDPAGLPAILAATHDKATVRRRAVIALAPFDGADVDDALRRAADDRDWQVRQAAEDQLAP